MVIHDSGTTWTRRHVLASFLGVGAVAPFVRGERRGADDSILLRYTAHVPNSHGLYAKVFVPWSAMVTRQTGGRIRWEHYVDALLHGALDGFKAVATGVTDYTHAYATYQPGSFHLTHGLQLPFLFPNPGVAALVSEELYPEYLKDEYERMGVYLAHCDSTSAYDIISKTPIRSPSDIRGLKVRATGGLTAEIIRQVGAVPVVMAAASPGLLIACTGTPRLKSAASCCSRAGLSMRKNGGTPAARSRHDLSAISPPIPAGSPIVRAIGARMARALIPGAER